MHNIISKTSRYIFNWYCKRYIIGTILMILYKRGDDIMWEKMILYKRYDIINDSTIMISNEGLGSSFVKT